MMMDEKELERRAREQVEAQKGFYVHLMTYILVNAGLFLINAGTRTRYGGWWFYWPLFGWGIGLVSHAFNVFGVLALFTSDWEERQVKKMMDKERRRQE
jgi:hypothetical protein